LQIAISSLKLGYALVSMEQLPIGIGLAAADGDFERVEAWLAGGTASHPRSVSDVDNDGWTLLTWIAISDESTPEHVEFARDLISRGCPVDAQSSGPGPDGGHTALHCACESSGGAAPHIQAAIVALLVAAGANVNIQAESGSGRRTTPLFSILEASASTLDIVTTLLRAGASLDCDGPTRSFEERLNEIAGSRTEHGVAIRNLVASVRAAGSWKAHCRLPHKQILRLRSLVARGRAKLPRARRRSPRDRGVRQERALEFVARQGDNGIVWNILSFWRATY